MLLPDLIRVAAVEGGRQALEALRDVGPALMVPPPQGLGMLLPDLIEVAARKGGRQALEALRDLGPALIVPPPQGLGMLLPNLIRIASKDGGRRALEGLRDVGPALLVAGFSKDHLVSIANHNGGGPALRAVHGRIADLQQGRVALDALVNAGSKRRGARNAVNAL
jgi:hypothetical protein